MLTPSRAVVLLDECDRPRPRDLARLARSVIPPTRRERPDRNVRMRRSQPQSPGSRHEKSEQLANQVLTERLQTLARLERVLSAQDAEDAYQEACVRALERLGQQAEESSLRAWFQAVLRSTIATRARELCRSRDEQTDFEPQLQSDRRDICPCGLRALGRLRSNYGGLLRRAILDGRPVQEIAFQDRATPNNTRVRLHRARSALRDAWSSACGPCITVDAGTSCACSGSCDGEGA